MNSGQKISEFLPFPVVLPASSKPQNMSYPGYYFDDYMGKDRDMYRAEVSKDMALLVEWDTVHYYKSLGVLVHAIDRYTLSQDMCPFQAGCDFDLCFANRSDLHHGIS